MIRKSFLRKIELQQLSIAEWDLPGIGTHKIGFGICPESGMIMQSPSPTPNQVNTYYKETAAYINPGRQGNPSTTKVKGLDRLINTTIDIIGYVPKSVFQVGCSDGYTLKRFREAGATSVTGIDPSTASHDIAKNLYNIDTIVSIIEDYEDKTNLESKNKYNLIILTHVLEHLFNPVENLIKCNGLQNDGDWIIVEVPLFERNDCFPPGMLTLEHLNYFSEGTIIETITKSGYKPFFSGKYFNQYEYPVITVIARKNNNFKIINCNDYIRANELLTAYVNKEKQSWKNTEKKIKDRVIRGSSVYIYGAGIHTSQLLAFTDLKQYLNILGLLDSSPTKWEKKIGSLTCYKKNAVDFKESDTIIISSFGSENEIYKSLTPLIQNGINIIKLYDN